MIGFQKEGLACENLALKGRSGNDIFGTKLEFDHLQSPMSPALQTQIKVVLVGKLQGDHHGPSCIAQPRSSAQAF